MTSSSVSRWSSVSSERHTGRRTSALRATLLCLAALATTASAGGGTTPPRQVVSINMCADLLLLSLAPRERIVSLSRYASDPSMSPLVERAKGIAINHARVEEVIADAPDLVLAGRFNSPETVALLRRLGQPVLVLDVPNSLSETRAQIRKLAAALGEQARAEQLIADMDARLARAGGQTGGAMPLAAVYRANSYTAGAGTLVDELLAAAGLRNLARDIGVRGWGNMGLEALLVGRPQLLVLDTGDQPPSLASLSLRHPALSAMRERVAVVEIPARLWICAGPWMAEAVELLAAARERLTTP